MTQKTKNKEVEKKLNLKDDIIFKAFFSRKGNEKFLIDFLNSILKIEISKISVQEEVNLEQLSKKEKGGRLDIQAILNSISKEYYIELPKFRKSNPDMNNKLNQWLAIIDDEDRGKIEMAKEKNDVIKEAEVEITYFTASEEARYLADMRDLWESDRVSELNYEKRIAQKEGREEGRKEGIKENEYRRNY